MMPPSHGGDSRFNSDRAHFMKPSNLLKIFRNAGKLKKEKRSGWVKSGVKNPESVADHSFRMALMALFLTPEKLDKSKVVNLCLIHDLAEAKTGDIITWKNHDMKKYEKKKLEQKAIKNISNNKQLLNLWNEYEERETKESKFAKQLDILEMVLQAYEYKLDKKEDELNKYIDTFFKTGKQKINNPKLKKLLNEIFKLK